MTQPIRNRSRLLLGCGSTALALALAMAPQDARAQAINATGNVVSGSASIDEMVPGQTIVDVASPTAVIDWTPDEDGNGNALDFLPTNTTALFQSGQQPNFAVLNRILPSTNGNIVVIDGTVLSRVNDVLGQPVAGGFVAFYSPTGILIGDNATFDVGQLMLTTLDVSPTDFQNFAELGGNMTLAATPGSTARIQINPGATITATPENSFFAVVAADVQMLGTAQVNGSHAFVAGEVVNLSFSNGLFFISVPVGTAATGTVMEVDGTVGGPSSNGLGDNHMIYGVAAAQADPISMIFRGNLGFAPAQSAGVVNGEIILSANYNVFGRFVDGGSISDGINAVFGANSATSNVRADILVEDITASSSMLAIGTHRTQVSALNSASSVAGNLLLVGRETAELTAGSGQNFTITGDVLVSAQDYGVASSTLQALDQIDATGGVAFIDALGGATMNIGGSARVLADAFAGGDDINGIAGTALGGQARIGATGGTLNITGNAEISARAVGVPLNNIQTGATSRGGLAQFFATQGGNVTLGGSLSLDAGATGAQGSLINPSSVSDAFGGNAIVNVFNGGGSLSIGGDVFANASATGGSSNNAGAGSVGDAGVAIANIDGAGQITITGLLSLAAEGIGGNNAGGIGGVGLGGRASSATFGGGGTIAIGSDFNANAGGVGGNGQTGGDGFGGLAGANAVIGSITIGNDASAFSEGDGGNASFGAGGTGGLGRGGSAFFQANGTLTAPASVSITGNATVSAQGFGGNGGASDGSTIAGGRGGDGYGGQFNVPNQADPAFGSGTYLLAGGDNGTLSIGGLAFALSNGFGGFGGSGSSILPGGRGGDAFGGLAQVGLALLGQDGSLGEGLASFGSLVAEANANGGFGGFSIGDFPTGDGGNATGGNAFLTVRAGTVTATDVTLNASAFAGDGAVGGLGTGGNAGVFGSLSGSLTTGTFLIRADGFGGFGGVDALAPGSGGDGRGGTAELDLQGITVQINGDATIQAEGVGGGAGDFTAGNGIGGTARLGMLGALGGSGTVTGNTIVSANGFGGSSGNFVGGIAGDGTGGTASIEAQGGGTVSLNTLQMMANGFAGESEVPGFQGGDGTGGSATITATGTNSQIIVARNVTTLQFSQQNFGAIMSATGVGGFADGGTGIGGTGRGGSVQLTASAGGSIALTADPLNDPDSVGFIRLFSRGFGGDTSVDGGTGGTSIGGSVAIDVDGGAFSMGETVLSSFTQGGTGVGTGINVTGGDAFAGSRRVSIRNGGTATLHFVGGGAGAQGGAGLGTGNGGNAYIGQNLFEVVNANANIIGSLAVFDQSQGGTGQQGGSVFNLNPQTGLTGSLGIVLDNANITFTPDAGGVSAIGMAFTTRGGDGIVRGGNAQGPIVNLTINQTDLAGGQLQISPFIEGGNASALDGIGGDALGSPITIAITNSQLTLPGETVFAADARGGAGGANAAGGNATSGPLDVTITGSTINLVADQLGDPGILRVRSQSFGGIGGVVGNALTDRAALFLIDSTISGAGVYVESRAFANASAPGQPGGSALSREARIELSGVSGITADIVEANASAASSQGGTATAGFASLQAASGSTATVTAPTVNLLADATGTADEMAGIAVTTQGGQALVAADGGSLTITGDVIANARGLGTTSANLLTGATSRGGSAQFFARLGGTLTLSGNLDLDASATGSNGSLSNGSSVSDAFGGLAVINVGASGGTISIGGTARALANAQGGSSNNAGAGSIGDAGVALANIQGAGLIDITGTLTLAAEAQGGTNAGGIGGVALGGRASAATFNGGIIRMASLDADTLAQGGDGQTGGDAFGGIAGVNAIIGEITIAGRAFAGSEAIGGNAAFGFGGNGGLGRAGNSFFQANGTLTQTATVSILGDAIAFAQGIGGNGGASDGNLIAAGRGGDGYGGQITVPNQADPAFGSGAYILAGGDNGRISVGGEAVAVASGFAGEGGIGGSVLPGGAGGNGFGGLAQIGLALFGLDGSVGQGQASFANVLAQAEGFGGRGGVSLASTVTGNGGTGTGGNAFLTVRAGDITANEVELSATAVGGEGALAGSATGGQAAVFGSLGGTFTAARLNIFAQGFGGFTFLGTGGDATGGLAAIEGDGITVTISGDALVRASASGGGSSDGAGGDAIGGEAYIATVTTNNPGTITITGHGEAQANGVGGSTSTGFAAGNGTGGLAYIEALGGSTISLGSAQAAAVGRGGSASAHEGGDGTGGIARLGAIGTGSRLTIQRNVPNFFAESLAGGAMLNANGIGETTNGGDGIGGTGRGGSISITASQGGIVSLPTDPASDPNSALPSLGFFARAFAGDSAVDGGAGGAAFGGNATILADGGTITMGPAALSPFAQGGNSLDAALNINGGSVTGGNRMIRVINGGTLSMQSTGGGSGGLAGNGSGTGNGGDVVAGSNLFEVIGSTVNLVGNFNLFNQSQGGNGDTGGDAGGGSLTFTASNATINLLPDATGNARLSLGGAMQGGNGVSAGGNAVASNVTVNITNSQIRGGGLEVNPLAIGGNASATNGLGGSAQGAQVAINVTGSQLDLVGEALFAADARGGASGTGATGGSATSGAVDAIVSGSQITINADGQGNPGILRVRSQADAGEGGAMGNATSGRAFLSLASSTLSALNVVAEARGFANANTAGQTGGTATGGSALINVAGNSTVTTGLVEIVSNAETSSGGSTLAGTSSLQVATGSTATINADTINLLADAFGASFGSLANAAGVVSVNIGGGNVNAGALFASATGDTISGDPPASELVASGGNLNVSSDLFVQALGDVLVRTGGGGIIGGPRAASTTTAVRINSGGTIAIEGDNNAAIGLGGAAINLAANDIDIANGARISADQVNIFVLDRVHTTILGGNTDGDGFTLTADEIGRISARQLSFDVRGLGNPGTSSQPDLLIRDLSLTGSRNNGSELVRIFTGGDGPGGIVRVEGTLSYSGAAFDDRLEVITGRLEVITPGGIRIEDSPGVPGGVLVLSARDIWAADADTIAQLQTDRSFAGRDALLAAATTGSDDPLGYLRARGIEISVRDSLLVRNTGRPFEGGGILVGDGGLSIVGTGTGTGTAQSTTAPQLDVFAYGRRRAADGSFILGEAFFDEVNFNRVAGGTTAYLDAAAFNDCIINTGLCPEPPPPPEPPVEPPVQINNPSIINAPLQAGSEPPLTSEEEEERFGMDFPEQPDAPLISEDPLLDDPVSSGGDASLYSGDTNAAPRGGEE